MSSERIAFPERAREQKTVEVMTVPVPSQSEEGKVYYVSLTATCQCKSWLYRQNCAHIKTVLDSLVNRG